ncbi:MAG: hypothetical protein J5654_12060, partial [Victivallales bacterium]|nr:hypothetical protein [Victivallales bacterium]
ESPLEPGLAAAAFERLRTTRDSWVEQWPAKDLIREKFATELEACRLPEDMAAPPVPRELENRSFYDFPARRLEAHAGDVTLVDAPESPVGKAMRSDVDANAQKYYDLPLELGFYDVGNRKSLGIIQFDKPVGSGYNWYRLPGTVRVPKDGTLYLTRAWTTQLRVAYPELIGRDFEVWASVKFTGPKFLADSTDKNYVFVDRVALVLPEGP